MDEFPIWIEIHREGVLAGTYFASEAKWHLSEGRLSPLDASRRVDAGGELHPLSELLRSLPKQLGRTTNQAEYLRSKGFFVWPGMRKAEIHHMINVGHEWRNLEMTAAQRELIQRFEIEPMPKMTRGEASSLIDELIQASQPLESPPNLVQKQQKCWLG